jgi:hypothetical protein
MKDQFFYGKRILFFCPRTFNYENEIIDALESMGAKVTFRSDRPEGNVWLKGLLRLFPRLMWLFLDRAHFSWLNRYGPIDSDIVFIVKGEGLSDWFVRILRERYSHARFVFYLWDSVSNVKCVEKKFPFFDTFFSFDPIDCRRMSFFKYRPLFFLERYLCAEEKASGNGLFFLGTLNGDRPAVVSKVMKSIDKKIKFDYWLFVRSRLELMLRRLIDRSLRSLDSSRLLFQTMPVSIIRQHIGEAAAVIDIEHPNQTGLTIRTFEVLASGKKLITTNRLVMEHEFYDPVRICVIDRNHPDITKEFLTKAPPPLTAEFVEKYSLRGWLKEILFYPAT